MKKQFLLLITVLAFNFYAQAQNFQRQTPEERTKATMEKMAPLKLTAVQSPKVNTVFLDLYNEQQKAMADMRASGTMDRDAIMAKRKELNAAAEVKLQAILTEEQFKQWKELTANTEASQKRN